MASSFAELRSNKSSLFSKLQKNLEESTKVGTVDERFWKLTTDKAGNGLAVIRFLPAPGGEDMPFVKLYNHFFQGPGGYYVENSLTTLGKKDPVGEFNRELWNSGDEALKDQVRKQKRKLNYYSNIYVVKDSANPENEGRVFLFRYGKKIFDMIMDVVNGDELEGRDGYNPFDLWEGADFVLRAKKVAGYPNYDSSKFNAQGTLEDLDDGQLESIWKRCHSLQAIVAADQFKSYEELQGELDRVLNVKSGGASVPAPVRVIDEPKVDVSSAPKFTKPEPVEETVEEEEDDDVLDYFKKLAEED